MKKALVVPRPTLFNSKYFQGFLPFSSFDYVPLIEEAYEYVQRGEDLENNSALQQIIPYVWIINPETKKVFAYKRANNANYNEARLRNKWSCGVGGHIDEEDSEKPVHMAMMRELKEEVKMNNYPQPEIIGFINDDSNPVGRVHFGVVAVAETTEYVEKGDDEMAQGQFYSVDELERIFSDPSNEIEDWTRISWPEVKKKLGLKSSKGVFIAFEGIDGCGKSTQLRRLAEHIFNKNKHNHIVITRNPYKDTNIREILTQDSDPLTQADKLADMFINDRRKQTEEIIKPNIDKGHFVLTDRYRFSTVAYQSAQGMSMDDLIKRQKDLPTPGITFIIDVSPETAAQRMKGDNPEVRGKENKFEAHSDFMRKIRENYLKIPSLMPQDKIYIINGSRDPEAIFAEIKALFEQYIYQLSLKP